MVVDAGALESQVTGLDALELASGGTASRLSRLWASAWPKLAAVALGLLVWQAIVWAGWKDETVLPSPPTVLRELWSQLGDGTFYSGVGITLRRAATGYGAAILIGSLVGMAVARSRLLRTAVGSLITGLATMPSIAWFPAAIVLFELSETAILFVVILGAAPSIANGLISGIDQVPPLLVRSGRMLGARGLSLYRHVVIPASLPSFVTGLKQGWAFAWRSLMAGELLVIISSSRSIGQQLTFSREMSDYPLMYAWMIVILVVGIAADSLFGSADRAIRRRWGLIDTAAP